MTVRNVLTRIRSFFNPDLPEVRVPSEEHLEAMENLKRAKDDYRTTLSDSRKLSLKAQKLI